MGDSSEASMGQNAVTSGVSEVLLKRRKYKEAATTQRAQQEERRRQQRQVAKNRSTFKRAADLVQDYRQKENETHRLRRIRRQQNTCPRKVEHGKLVLVLRRNVEVIDHVNIRKSLHILRLGRKHSGAFVQLNERTATLLAQVEPYVHYGTPTLKTVSDLIHKRGYTIIDGKPVAISSNIIVENALGEHGLICVEDLIHEIVTTGEHFGEANKFLCPFHFSNPTQGWREKKLTKVHGTGDKGKQDVNQLVEAWN